MLGGVCHIKYCAIDNRFIVFTQRWFSYAPLIGSRRHQYRHGTGMMRRLKNDMCAHLSKLELSHAYVLRSHQKASSASPTSINKRIK